MVWSVRALTVSVTGVAAGAAVMTIDCSPLGGASLFLFEAFFDMNGLL
jgi:hypothetical protein